MHPLQTFIDDQFRALVLTPQYSCVGAKSAIHRNTYTLRVYDGAGYETAQLAADLSVFAAALQPDVLSSFVAVWVQQAPPDDREFERLLWNELVLLHKEDIAPWAEGYSADLDDPHFAFSFAGRAFFVVGMHPHANRLTRRFAYPAIIFNPHEQFVRLRAHGVFDRMRDVIRQREMALQGSLNPHLSDHGTVSEARQYAGREGNDPLPVPHDVFVRG